MADYYPLIAGAIARLDPGAPGESRRALYERARAALMAQLRSVEPPLSESEITRERLSLEEAVRKVESEAAQRARDASRSASTERARAGDALRSFRDIAADADDLGRAARKTYANVPSPSSADQKLAEMAQQLEAALRRHADDLGRAAGLQGKRYPDSLRSREQLEEEAKRTKAKAEASALEEKQRLENKLEELRRLDEIEQATREQDDVRRQREDQEAARVQKDARRQFARAQLAKVASPAPSLAPDGRLDAGPNIVYDEPNNSDDLPTLPLRQRAVIKSILSDLPGNSPTYLKTSLQSYDDELKVRGAQPILGLLKDMFEIIAAAVGDPDAQQEWLGPGLKKAFEKIAENHDSLVSHFPLDPEREDLYAQTLVEENEATGRSLSEPFRHVAHAAQDANKAGLATDDFLRVVDKMAEFAKIISTLPLSPPPSVSARPNPQNFGAEVVAIKPEDRIGASGQPISSRKRMLLSGVGFFERTYNLLSSTVTIGGTSEGLAFLNKLREAISALSNFLP